MSENPGVATGRRAWLSAPLDALLVLAALGGALVALLNPDPPKLFGGVEVPVFALGPEPTGQVFGYGDKLGVSATTREAAHFEFEYAPEAAQAWFVSFEGRGIAPGHEPRILLNGVLVGVAQADVVTQPQLVRLPSRHLRAPGKNRLTFDHPDNPPSARLWAIARVHLVQREEKPGDGARTEGPQRALARAREHLDASHDAPVNRFLAWVELYRALDLAEEVEPRPAVLEAQARALLARVEEELAAICAGYLERGAQAEKRRDWDGALAEYRNGQDWFPASDDEHPCRRRLREAADEVERRRR